MTMFRRVPGVLRRLVTFPIRLARDKISVQLVYSHVLVVFLATIVSGLALGALLLGLLYWAPEEFSEPNWALGDDVQIVARMLGGDEIFQSSNLDLSDDERQQIEDRLVRFTVLQDTSVVESASALRIDRALITDTSGTVVATTDPQWAQRGQSARAIDTNLVAHTTARAVELRGEPTRFDNTWLIDWNDAWTVASHPILNDRDEFVGVITIQSGSNPAVPPVVSRDTILAFVGVNVLMLVATTVPAFLVSVPVGIWTARKFSRRLSAVAEAADAMAQGNLSRRVDVTGHDEISRLSERFNEMSSRLAEVDRSRRSFVANVSHELRTPISIIEGHVESLVQSDGDNRSLAVIQQEAKTLERLVDDLFILARIEEAVLPFNLNPVEVHAVVAEAVEGMKTVAWEQRKVTVQSLVSPGVPAVVADHTRLRQILGNLLYNALRHTTEGGLVIVNAAARDDMVELSVTDTGIGIGQDELSLVFDRFYQTERAGRHSEGSGLGLAIVKQLVEAQGGSIDVTSVPGEGTTFRFRLPRAASG